jgi:hypothetical protein
VHYHKVCFDLGLMGIWSGTIKGHNPLTRQEREQVKYLANKNYAISRHYSSEPLRSEFYRGRSVGMGKIAQQFNPKVNVHPLALEAKKKWKEDMKAGHGKGEEYWAGYAGAAFLMSNPLPLITTPNRVPSNYDHLLSAFRKTEMTQSALSNAIQAQCAQGMNTIGVDFSSKWWRIYAKPVSRKSNPVPNRFYKVSAVAPGLKQSYPLNEVKPGTKVKALEYGHGLDVIDVRMPDGSVKNVYAFQLIPSGKAGNPFPAKTAQTRKFHGIPFYYIGRTIYPSKAWSIASELKSKGLGVAITNSKGAGKLIWASQPVYVDMTEPIWNPKCKLVLNPFGVQPLAFDVSHMNPRKSR